ncbi:sialin-like [Gigantopelta aegis]|uniref:sialin-like n=1 Tax=Gigantopelta aegis TaxID=1735272 RepID=UPI001B88AC52|nr:sialin-like [Gigantopelta aegis]
MHGKMISTRTDDEVDCLIERISDTESVEKAEKLYSYESYPGIQKRHVLTIWAFLGFFNVYCLRVNLSVALVAMVNNTDSSKNDSQSTECVGPNDTTTNNLSGEFPWNEETQGWVLGAFFYGYIITQIPGGYLAATFGAKRLFAYGILCTSVLTLLTPVAARLHLGVLIALRVVEGLGEGVTFPCMHAMWGNWAPVWERSKLTGFAYAGC